MKKAPVEAETIVFVAVPAFWLVYRCVPAERVLNQRLVYWKHTERVGHGRALKSVSGFFHPVKLAIDCHSSYEDPGFSEDVPQTVQLWLERMLAHLALVLEAWLS